MTTIIKHDNIKVEEIEIYVLVLKRETVESIRIEIWCVIHDLVQWNKFVKLKILYRSKFISQIDFLIITY